MPAFETQRQLHHGDCDPAGIAYFPAYLNILVGVVEDFFAELGAPWHGMAKGQRLTTPTVKLEVTFVKPGFHGDKLGWRLAVERVGGASLTLRHEVSSGGKELWRAQQILVCTHLDELTSRPWPETLRQAFARYSV